MSKLQIGIENLRLAKELGLEPQDVPVLARAVEILNVRSALEALRMQDEAELKIGYLKAKYRRLAQIAERDYKVQRGYQRMAQRDDWTSPRGKVDEGLADFIENDLHDLRNRREASSALCDLLWGMRDTVYARRRSLEERNITARKDD